MKQTVINKQEQHFRIHLLTEELNSRKNIFKSYSLRKFALELEISPSVLSKLLNGKRTITNPMYRRILSSLNIRSEVIALKKEAFFKKSDVFKYYKEDFKEFFTSWHSFAILEALNLDKAEFSVQWISRTTGINQILVEQYIDRMIECGLIIKSHNCWIDNFHNISFISSKDMDVDYGRSFQESLLDISKESINKLSGKRKDHTNIIFSINTDLIPEVKDKIRDFRRELAHFITTNSKNDNDIYNLQFNLHPINVNKGNRQ